MILSYRWLNEYVDVNMLGADIGTLVEALTGVGLKVEGLEPYNSDYQLDVEVTTNRPDCLNHLGVAREIAAHFRLALKKPDLSAPPSDSGLSKKYPTSVEILAPELCPRYAARIVTDIRIEPSPEWLQKRLESVDQRPISNIVDITNYVLFALGHPLHAFDYDRLQEGRIVVRRAAEGESITTLDGRQRSLDPSVLAICDAEKPVAVAGVMGGEESEISDSTRTLLLESAYFAPMSVRQTSKKLGLRTEASYRFERGADPEMPVRALNLATRLITEIAGGRCAGDVIDENPLPHQRLRVPLREKRIQQVMGMDIPAAEVEETLQRLEFQLEKEDPGGWQVTVPGFRVDVSIEDDLVEEAARHYGYEKVPGHYPPPTQAGRRDPAAFRRRTVSDLLVGLGFYEAYNYAFSDPGREALFRSDSEDLVALLNPLSEVDSHLRGSLLPGLLKVLQHNLNHGAENVRLFETGHVFSHAADQGRTEEERLGLIAEGKLAESWISSPQPFAFFHLKGVVEAVASSLKVKFDYCKAELPGFHPGRCARIVWQESEIGKMGELHPELCERLKLQNRPVAAEIVLDRLPRPPAEITAIPLSRFPSVERDISLVVDKGVEFGRINAAVRSLKLVEFKDFRLIDFYRGSNLPQDKISLTVRLTLAHPERTLTQDEVGELTDRVVQELRQRFGVELRS